MTTNDELIARARELDAAATPGPWTADQDGDVYSPPDEDVPRGFNPSNVVAASAWNVADRRYIAESRTMLGQLATALEQSEKAHIEAEKEHAAFRRRLLKILKPVGIDKGLLDIELAQIRMQDLATAEASASQALRDLGELRHEFGQYRLETRPVVDAVLELQSANMSRATANTMSARTEASFAYANAVSRACTVTLPKGTK